MHNIFFSAHNSHGGVDSSLFNSIDCVGGALDWITVEYFSLAYIHPPLLLTLLSAISPVVVCLFSSRKGSLFDAFAQLLTSSNSGSYFCPSNIQREVKFHLNKHILKRLKHQGQVWRSMWYVSAENAFSPRSEWLMWIRVLRPFWGGNQGGCDQFTRNLESLMHWCKTAFFLKTDLHHSCRGLWIMRRWEACFLSCLSTSVTTWNLILLNVSADQSVTSFVLLSDFWRVVVFFPSFPDWIRESIGASPVF